MATKKIEEMNKLLNKMKNEKLRYSDENKRLQSKIVELTDRNMDFYGRAHNDEISKLHVHDYQKLIFGFVQKVTFKAFLLLFYKFQ